MGGSTNFLITLIGWLVVECLKWKDWLNNTRAWRVYWKQDIWERRSCLFIYAEARDFAKHHKGTHPVQVKYIPFNKRQEGTRDSYAAYNRGNYCKPFRVT
jgi:hypothetical protein